MHNILPKYDLIDSKKGSKSIIEVFLLLIGPSVLIDPQSLRLRLLKII